MCNWTVNSYTLCIAVCVLLCHNQACCMSGDSDLEGSGAEDVSPTEVLDPGSNESDINNQSCKVPVYSTINYKRSFPLPVAEDHSLIVEGRCYVRCIQEATLKFSSKVGNNTDFPPWPFHFLKQNCNTHARVHECTRGCVLATTGLESRGCVQQCEDDCSSECGGATCSNNPDSDEWWVRTNCHFNCHTDNCQPGCDISLTSLQGENPPLSPEAPPMLSASTESSRAGMYRLDISHSVPVYNHQSLETVVFLFEILDHTTGNYSYHWETDPREMLDLSDFACRNVSVRFAVLNQFSLSDFSDYNSLGQVYGDATRRPSPIDSIRVTEQDDTRLGFFGHVTWSISWSSPPNQLHLEEFYLVVSTTELNCGRRVWSTHVNISDDLTVLVSAEEPGELLIMGCFYNIEVHSIGLDENDTFIEFREASFFPSVPTFSFITDLQCHKIWDPVEFAYSFNFTWSLPLLMAVEVPVRSYLLSLDTIGLEIIEGGLPKDILLANVGYRPPNLATNDTDFHFYVPHDGRDFFRPRQTRENLVFRFELFFNFESSRVRFNSNSVEVPANRREFECFTGTESPIPTAVQNISISSSSLVSDSLVSLQFSWRPPSQINGELVDYYTCLSRRVLLDQEDPTPHDGNHFCLEVQNNVTEASLDIQYIRDDFHCRYFQMRARNEFVSGNWSEPLTVYLNTEGLCTSEVSSDAVITGVCVVLGLLLAVCGVCVCVCLLCCARRRKRNWEISDVSTGPGLESMFGPAHAPLFSTEAKLPEADEWEVPPAEVMMEDSLGEGAFGEVYKGLLKGPLRCSKLRPSLRNAIAVPVAIKLLKDSARGSERQDFLSEIDMMKSISEGQNPNVIGMVGCVTLQEPLSLILEFVAFGDLLSYLRTNMKINSGQHCDDNPYLSLGSIETVDLVNFSYQIASGMEYLSSLGIVHRDLACRNILVDEGKVLKITDFGMSREVDEIYVQQSKGRVPLKWMALESILTRQFTSASDVWSYGIALWEISTMGGFPYPAISNEELILQLKNGYRMEKPDNCSPEIYEIMLACWESDPRRRPSFSSLKAQFGSMLQSNVDYIYFLPVISDKACYKPEKTSESNGVNRLSLCSFMKAPPTDHGLSSSDRSLSNGRATPRGPSPRSTSPANVSPYRNGTRPNGVQRIANAYVDNPSLAKVRSSSMHFVQPPRESDGSSLATRGTRNQRPNSVVERSDGGNLWRGYVNMQTGAANGDSVNQPMRSNGELARVGMEVVNPLFGQECGDEEIQITITDENT